MNNQFLRKYKILYFDEQYFELTIQIINALKKLGAYVDFYPLKYKNTLLKKFAVISKLKSRNFYLNKYLKNIIEKTKNKKYDYIFVKSPTLAPISFFEKLKNFHKNTKIINYNWRSIKHSNYLPYRNLFDKIFSFDIVDSKKYSFINYLPLFYTDEFKKVGHREPPKSYSHDLLFVGVYRDERYQLLKKIYEICKNNGLKPHFYLYMPFKKYIKFRSQDNKVDFIGHEYLTHKQIANLIYSSKVVLDIRNDIQNGLNMRVFETLGAGRKLVTTDENIVNEPFYDEDYISIIDKKNPNIDLDFIKQRTRLQEIKRIRNYYIDNWLKNMFYKDIRST